MMNLARSVSISVCILFLIPFIHGAVETIFVDGSLGHDTNCTGTATSPCASLPRAFDIIDKSTLSDFVVSITGDLVQDNATAVLKRESSAGLSVTIRSHEEDAQVNIKGGAAVGFQVFGASVRLVFEKVQFKQHDVAVQIKTGIVEFHDCHFTENKVSLSQQGGSSVVTGGTFTNNRQSFRLDGGSSTFDSVSLDHNVNDGPTVTAARGTSLTLNKVVFDSNNNTRGDGILKVVDGSITVTSSNFTGNSAGEGTAGAIHASNATGTITHGNFTGNMADNGAALGIYNGTSLTILYTVFLANKAAKEGGAIFVERGPLVVQNCTFESNHADVNGGSVVIYNQGNDGNETATFSRCNMTKNTSPKGNNIWMLFSSNVRLDHLVVTQSTGPVFCADSSIGNVTSTHTNTYCVPTCRSPQCAFCPGLCLLDNSNNLDDSGSGDCYSSMTQGCNNGICRLALKEKKSHAECECNATWGSDVCDRRSYMFYILIVLSGLVLATVVAGVIFTIQNRMRRKWGYHSLNY